jgi:hypothetical protein
MMENRIKKDEYNLWWNKKIIKISAKLKINLFIIFYRQFSNI